MVAVTQSEKASLIRIWRKCQRCLANWEYVPVEDRLKCVQTLNYVTPLLILFNIDF